MMIIFELVSLPIAYGLILGLLWICAKLVQLLNHLGWMLDRRRRSRVR